MQEENITTTEQIKKQSEDNELPYLPPEMVQIIAYFSDRRERRILGFTMDLCILLKFPPNKIHLPKFIVPQWSVSICYYGGGTYWSSPNSSRETGMGIHRIANGRKDDYSINDIKYNYTFNYDTGEIWHWINKNKERSRGHSVTEIHPAYQTQRIPHS